MQTSPLSNDSPNKSDSIFAPKPNKTTSEMVSQEANKPDEWAIEDILLNNWQDSKQRQQQQQPHQSMSQLLNQKHQPPPPKFHSQTPPATSSTIFPATPPMEAYNTMIQTTTTNTTRSPDMHHSSIVSSESSSMTRSPMNKPISFDNLERPTSSMSIQQHQMPPSRMFSPTIPHTQQQQQQQQFRRGSYPTSVMHHHQHQPMTFPGGAVGMDVASVAASFGLHSRTPSLVSIDSAFTNYDSRRGSDAESFKSFTSVNSTGSNSNSIVGGGGGVGSVVGGRYKCTKPYCTKVYKNANGLRYHLENGNCELDATMSQVKSREELNQLEANDVRITSRPFFCRIEGCDKRYKNVNGLKYHAKTTHPELDFNGKVKGCLVPFGAPY